MKLTTVFCLLALSGQVLASPLITGIKKLAARASIGESKIVKTIVDDVKLKAFIPRADEALIGFNSRSGIKFYVLGGSELQGAFNKGDLEIVAVKKVSSPSSSYVNSRKVLDVTKSELEDAGIQGERTVGYVGNTIGFYKGDVIQNYRVERILLPKKTVHQMDISSFEMILENLSRL